MSYLPEVYLSKVWWSARCFERQKSSMRWPICACQNPDDTAFLRIARISPPEGLVPGHWSIGLLPTGELKFVQRRCLING